MSHVRMEMEIEREEEEQGGSGEGSNDASASPVALSNGDDEEEDSASSSSSSAASTPFTSPHTITSTAGGCSVSQLSTISSSVPPRSLPNNAPPPPLRSRLDSGGSIYSVSSAGSTDMGLHSSNPHRGTMFYVSDGSQSSVLFYPNRMERGMSLSDASAGGEIEETQR